MSAALPESHRVCLGRLWAASKLDAMLADPVVRMDAMSVLSAGLLPDDDFCREHALRIARLRYRRIEPAALLTQLATRLWVLRMQGGADASR